jgi:hypothetical protein
MWKQQSRDELGDDSTVDAALSDNSDAKRDRKGKGHKKPRAPQQLEDYLAAEVTEDPAEAATSSAMAVQGTLPVEPLTEPTELTQVVVAAYGAGETSDEGKDEVPAPESKDELLSHSDQTPPSSSSHPASGSGPSSPKMASSSAERVQPRKKKSGKKW